MSAAEGYRDVRTELADLNKEGVGLAAKIQQNLDYNRENDRVTVKATFAQLVELASSLDVEQRRAADEGLSDTQLALFDLLFKDAISKADRERLKQASKGLLASLRDVLRPMHDWTQNTTTQAEVKVFTQIGKYGRAVKATKAAPALLPLPSRERVGVRVHRGAAFPPHPDPLPQWGRGKWSGTRFALFRNWAKRPV